METQSAQEGVLIWPMGNDGCMDGERGRLSGHPTPVAAWAGTVRGLSIAGVVVLASPPGHTLPFRLGLDPG